MPQIQATMRRSASATEVPTGQQNIRASLRIGGADSFDRFLSNADCWQQIAQLLNYKARARCERSCTISKTFFDAFWQSSTHFDATRMSVRPSDDVDDDVFPQWSAVAVLGVCARIGDSLLSLKLTDAVAIKWTRDLPLIARTCPNIETIDFRVESIADYLPPIWDGRYILPLDISFASFANLKTLRLHARERPSTLWQPTVLVADTFLPDGLSPSLEILTGINCNPILEDLSELFRDTRFANLKKLDLSIPRDLTDEPLLPAIRAACPNLRRLTLGAWPDSHAFRCDGIESLAGMLELDLQCSPLSDTQMVAVCAANPALEVLSLDNPAYDNLSPIGFCAIAALRKLRYLRIVTALNNQRRDVIDGLDDFVERLVDSSRASLASLILGDTYMSDSQWLVSTASIEAIARKCPRMRYLHIDVSPASASPASIRYLIECITSAPEWKAAVERFVVRIGLPNADAEARRSFFELVEDTHQLPSGALLSFGYPVSGGVDWKWWPPCD